MFCNLILISFNLLRCNKEILCCMFFLLLFNPSLEFFSMFSKHSQKKEHFDILYTLRTFNPVYLKYDISFKNNEIL